MDKLSKEKYYALILAGGGGTRLWPRSRNLTPKQFLKIGSPDTLLQQTYQRLARFLPVKNIFVVTINEYLKEIKNELPEISSSNILLEPKAKNTAAAIALGVWEINKKDTEAVIGSFASDHLVKNEPEFLEVIETAFWAAANSSDIITVGILPTKADDGLGYIRVGVQITEINKRPIFRVKNFVEKPEVSLAKAFMASGEYFWNASYFMAKASTFLSTYSLYLPEVVTVLEKIEKDREQKEKLWRSLKSVAIDYAIMEKATNLSMVTADFGWSDIGNWQILSEVSPTSYNGHILLGDIEGKHVMVDSKNCLLYGAGRLIATIGVSDLIIVDSSDALLICQKSRAQEVKKIVEKLKTEGKKEYL